MKLFIIAKSNINRNKSMSLTLTALIALSAILLYIGTSVILSMNTFLDKKNSELEGPDFVYIAPKQLDETMQCIMGTAGSYDFSETEDAVVAWQSTVRNIERDDKAHTMKCLFLSADRSRTLAKLTILEEGKERLPNSIILPYYLKVAKGYQTGDTVEITNNGKVYDFIIYGFSEDIMFAVPSNLPYYKCFILDERFNQLYNENAIDQFSYGKAKLPEGDDIALYTDTFIKQMNNTVKESISTVITMEIETMKVGISYFLIVIMAILIAVSMIILLIALTVMRFAIVTHIEGNIKNIGSMEALGYTGKELILSTLLQFFLIGGIGITAGLAIAISGYGMVTNLVSSSIGLRWEAGVSVIAILINYLAILSLVMAITYLAASKIKKVTPIMALRSGIESHNFKRNHLPMDKSPWNVHFTLGLKGLLQNMKQNVVILIIVTLLSFICLFVFTVNYNFNVDNTALLRLIGIEKAQLQVIYQGEEPYKVFEELEKLPYVNKTARFTIVAMTVAMGDREVTPNVTICNDFNLVEISTIVEGRYPIHDNEIVVTGLILERLGAEIGSVVSLGANNVFQEYIIVGTSQQINNLGRGACITEEGMKRLNGNFVPTQLNVYLDSSKNIEAVQTAIEKQYRGSDLVITNLEETYNAILESFNKAVNTLCIACIIVTLGIIALILILLIKIKLIKERLRLGVAKALGFTTRQIILQIMVSFCPVCFLGIILGIVLAVLLINPAFAAMLSPSGIFNSSFEINSFVTWVSLISLCIFTAMVTALVARSTKRITPYELFC